MKEKIALLLLLFVTTVCSAQIKLEANGDGDYRVEEKEWRSSEITAEPDALQYLERFSQAIESPGTPILVGKEIEILRLKPVFKILVEADINIV